MFISLESLLFLLLQNEDLNYFEFLAQIFIASLIKLKKDTGVKIIILQSASIRPQGQ
jgi:hypothetical protein